MIAVKGLNKSPDGEWYCFCPKCGKRWTLGRNWDPNKDKLRPGVLWVMCKVCKEEFSFNVYEASCKIRC